MAITLTDLQELRKQVEESRKRLQEQERALEVVEGMVRAQGALMPTAQASELSTEPSAPASGMAKPSISMAVRKAIYSFGGREFQRPEVDYLLRADPDFMGSPPNAQAIASAIAGLQESKEVVITMRGHGSSPHKYRATPKLAERVTGTKLKWI